MLRKKLSPVVSIFLMILGVMIIGGLLLKLPFAVQDGEYLSWDNAFFISSSAVCVTGLSPVTDLSLVLSPFGKVVLALLIQIGGLGMVTIAIFALTLLGAKIGAWDRILVKEALNQNSNKGMVKLVLRIVMLTFIIELFGTILNMIALWGEFPFWKNLGLSAFHAISSFNNCGFDLFGSSSLMLFENNYLLQISTMILIVLGGLGFIVISDILENRRWSKLSIHSKIVLIMTTILIIVGMFGLKFSEGLLNENFSWLDALFQSITLRTAGFYTIKLSSLNLLTIFIMMGFMFIGASPSSTGGGIKTTTLFVMFKSVSSFSFGKTAKVFDRKIGSESKIKAFTITCISMAVIFLFAIILLAIEQNNPNFTVSIENILFEVISAFGTVGLSLGVTPYLSAISKILLCFLMMFGRLGALTIFSLWNKNWNNPNSENVGYLEEKMIIG